MLKPTSSVSHFTCYNLDMNENTSQVAKSGEKTRAAKTSKKSLFVWLLLLLLPVALFLPVVGGELQRSYIGNEYPCCALSSESEYVAKAEHAKSLHWLSNLIVGGGILLALVLTVATVVIICRYGIPKKCTKSVKTIIKFVLVITAIPLLILLLAAMIYFSSDNERYYRAMSQPPGNTIYYYVLREW